MFAADEFAGFLENAAGIFRNKTIEGPADGGIGSDTAGAVAAATDGSHDEFIDHHGGARGVLQGLQHAGQLFAAGLDGGSGAALVLNHEKFRLPAGFADRFQKTPAVESFAAERNQQDGSDIRVRAKAPHHSGRVFVRVAAAESQ